MEIKEWFEFMFIFISGAIMIIGICWLFVFMLSTVPIN